jgi:hypothetical protein
LPSVHYQRDAHREVEADEILLRCAVVASASVRRKKRRQFKTSGTAAEDETGESAVQGGDLAEEAQVASGISQPAATSRIADRKNANGVVISTDVAADATAGEVSDAEESHASHTTSDADTTSRAGGAAVLEPNMDSVPPRRKGEEMK